MSNIHRKKKKEIKKQKEQNKKLYPTFVFFNEEAVEPEFCKIVKDALQLMLNPTFIPIISKKSHHYASMYDFMKDMKKFNSKLASKQHMNTWKSSFEKNQNNPNKPINFTCYLIGDFILNYSEKIQNYIPYSGFIVGIKCGIRDCFYIKFKKIKKYSHSFGSRYKSIDTTQENINGKNYEVVFSTHCINRFQERFTEGKIKLYSQLHFFYNLIEKSKYKLIFNDLGCPMLEMYCPVVNEFNSIAKQLESSVDDLPFLDSENRKNYCHIHMKYFYLPVTVEKDKMVCLTALLPGFKNTPEYKFRKNNLHKKNKRIFNSKEEEELFVSNSSSATNFYSNENAQAFDERYKDVLMWFHKNGFIQFVHASSNKVINIYNIETEKEIKFV